MKTLNCIIFALLITLLPGCACSKTEIDLTYVITTVNANGSVNKVDISGMAMILGLMCLSWLTGRAHDKTTDRMLFGLMLLILVGTIIFIIPR